MVTEVRLDESDAVSICETLFCLAKLINPKLGNEELYKTVELTEGQRQALTEPVASWITTSPVEMANKMLDIVGRIQVQLGDDAPAL